MKPGQTSNFLGPAHNTCNLARKTDKRVPVLFHNGSAYDIHLFIEELVKQECNINSIVVTAKTAEKYSCVKTSRFKFIDSMQHLPSSLDKLASEIPEDSLLSLKEFCQVNWPGEDRKFKMLRQKLTFPFSFLDSPQKLDCQIPGREHFMNDLTNTSISDIGYRAFLDLKAEFALNTVRELLTLYNIIDVLLLSDIWSFYRKNIWRDYGLEVASFSTSPGLSWSIALKMTKVKLQLLTNPDMYIFFENGIRGGLSNIFRRRASANNPSVPGYDPSKPTTHIVYFDSVNLYGRGLSSTLPYGDFK